MRGAAGCAGAAAAAAFVTLNTSRFWPTATQGEGEGERGEDGIARARNDDGDDAAAVGGSTTDPLFLCGESVRASVRPLTRALASFLAPSLPHGIRAHALPPSAPEEKPVAATAAAASAFIQFMQSPSSSSASDSSRTLLLLRARASLPPSFGGAPGGGGGASNVLRSRKPRLFMIHVFTLK